MRTIKTFEGFKKKDIESLIQPIKDSFLDLEDIGLIVKARVQDNRIHIHIDRSTYDYYKGYDVIETLLFAIPYLESEYNLKLGKCEIFTDDNYNITFILKNLIEMIKGSDKIESIVLRLRYENN